MWDDDRDNQLDRWADHGPALTWGGVWWSLGTIAVLVLLALLNAWRG